MNPDTSAKQIKEWNWFPNYQFKACIFQCLAPVTAAFATDRFRHPY